MRSDMIEQAISLLNKARGHNRATRLPGHTEWLVLQSMAYAREAARNLTRADGDPIAGDPFDSTFPCPKCRHPLSPEHDLGVGAESVSRGEAYQDSWAGIIACPGCKGRLDWEIDPAAFILHVSRDENETCPRCWRGTDPGDADPCSCDGAP